MVIHHLGSSTYWAQEENVEISVVYSISLSLMRVKRGSLKALHHIQWDETGLPGLLSSCHAHSRYFLCKIQLNPDASGLQIDDTEYKSSEYLDDLLFSLINPHSPNLLRNLIFTKNSPTLKSIIINLKLCDSQCRPV